MTKEKLERYILAIERGESATVIGGEREADGTVTMPSVDYSEVLDELVEDFYQSELEDLEYRANAEGLIGKNLLPDSERIAAMTIAEIGTCLTYIIRGERFCDGHILRFLKNGALKALLERLLDIVS